MTRVAGQHYIYCSQHQQIQQSGLNRLHMSDRRWGEEGELQISLNKGAHRGWGGTFLMSAEKKSEKKTS